MPSITSIVETAVAPYKTAILVVVVSIIFSVAAYYVYARYSKNMAVKKPTDDIANADRRNDTAEILFFYADWCPHCTAAKPEWEAFKASVDGHTIDGYTVKCVDVNCTDSDNAAVATSMQKYEVEHFPTVKLMKNGDVIDFDSKISEASLGTFINTILK
jgi:thiol-disulfide isomerase/thioredoxin